MSHPITGLEPKKSSVGILGLVILILAILIGGAIVGGLLFLSSKLIYLIFVSPLFAALLAGGVGWRAAHITKARNGLMVFLVGMLIGLGAYGVYRYAEYLDVMEQEAALLVTQVREEYNTTITQAEAREFLDKILVEDYGVGGFMGYIRFDADMGMSITSSRSFDDSEGNNIGTELTVGYWILEVLMMGGLAGFVAFGKTNAPFCETENKWLKYAKVGEVSKDNIDLFVDAIENSQWSQAASMITPKGGKMPKLIVEMGRCSDQAPDGMLKVSLRSNNRNDPNKVLLESSVLRDEYNTLNPS